KSLRRKIEDHFTSVNRGIALRKAGQFLEGLETPEEDDAEYTARQRRLAAGRERSYTTTHDEGLEDVPEDAGPQLGGETPIDGPEFQPLAWRVAAREHAILQA